MGVRIPNRTTEKKKEGKRGISGHCLPQIGIGAIVHGQQTPKQLETQLPNNSCD